MRPGFSEGSRMEREVSYWHVTTSGRDTEHWNMKTRREIVMAMGLPGLVLTLSTSDLLAQQRPIRLGWMVGSVNPRTSSFNVAFEQRLKELGYIDGQNILIDFASAQGLPERMTPVALELVARKPDVLFVGGPEAPLRALVDVAGKLPIVVCAVDYDPQAKGYLKSLARPEGNITGVHFQQVEATAKRLELMRKLLPAARRITVLSDRNTADQLTAARAAAKVLGLELHVLELGTPPIDMARVMDEAQAARAQGLLVLMSPTFFAQRDSILREAGKRNLAAVAGMAQFGPAGAIVSYGTSIDAMFTRSADYVDKIIKGKRPSELPMEQPTTFEFVVNLKAARALGIKVPQEILLQATNVIE